MAGRIKGITVEIGGDTTGLEQALKSVNSTIRTTQSHLKDVTKLLKLDPSNTELLSQKQKNLKDAISATKEKLEALKAAQEQAKKQLEEGSLGQDKYDALQREIIETEQELKRLQDEAINTNAALEKIDQVGKKMQSVGDSISSAGEKLLPVTGAVAAVGTAAVKTTADFDAGMSKVAAISGAAGKDLDDLREKAREMGAKTKFSATEAASAFEYMAMAGWKTGDMLSGIEGIMNLAAASGESLATTSDIVTDALTAFGLSADDSAHFADILAAASSNANTNVSMMGETFKYCAPIAGALGFSAEDTAQAIGLMANAGIKSSQAGTSLRTIMNNLSGPIELAGKKLGEVTIETTNADGSMRNLSDILADCRWAFSQLSESEKASAAEAIFGKNAMSGFLALMNAGESDINKLSSAIANCDGTAEAMASTMQDNLSGQLTILKSQLEELAISFGEILMPMVRKVVSAVQSFVDKLNAMSDAQRETVIKVMTLAAALGPLLIVIGKTISTVGVAMQGFSKLGKGIMRLSTSVSNAGGMMGVLGKAVSAITSPVGIAVAAIAVLVAAFVHLWQTNEEFRNKMTAIWERVKKAFASFTEGIRSRLEGLGIDFSSVTATIHKIWEGFCAVLAPVFEGAFSTIVSILETVFSVITGLFDVFAGIFTGNWSSVWTGVKEIFSSVWDGMKGIISAALDTIRGVADTVLSWFGTSWNETWISTKTFFEGIWNGITSFLSSVWTTFTGIVQTGLMLIGSIIEAAVTIITLPFRAIWENCKGIITKAWNSIKTVVSTAVNAVSKVITSVLNTVKGVISSVMTAVKSIFSTVWDAIKGKVTTALSAIKNTVSTVLSSIKTTASSIWNSIKSVIGSAVDGVKSKVSSVFQSVKSLVSSIFDSIKSKATTAWNGVKSAITGPIESAKNTIKASLDKISSFFSSVKLQLPKIKLPHFSISGSFSIAPPSVPHLKVDWYKEGGIMTKPTVFGMKGSALMAGGEAGAEAILPLEAFYKELNRMLSDKFSTATMEKYLAVIAANSGKEIYLDDGTLVGRLLPAIDKGLGRSQKLGGRLKI